MGNPKETRHRRKIKNRWEIATRRKPDIDGKSKIEGGIATRRKPDIDGKSKIDGKLQPEGNQTSTENQKSKGELQPEGNQTSTENQKSMGNCNPKETRHRRKIKNLLGIATRRKPDIDGKSKIDWKLQPEGNQTSTETQKSMGNCNPEETR